MLRRLKKKLIEEAIHDFVYYKIIPCLDGTTETMFESEYKKGCEHSRKIVKSVADNEISHFLEDYL